MQDSFDHVAQCLASDSRCVFAHLTFEVAQLMPAGLDIHDAIICATAIMCREDAGAEAHIPTAEQSIVEWGEVNTIW